MRFKSKRNFISVIILLIILCVISAFGIPSGGGYLLKPVYQRINQGLDLKGGVYVVYEAQTDATGDELAKIINQTIEVFRKRIDGMGLTEPVIVRDGDKRIRIELPGATNVNDAIQTIGKTAQLTFLNEEGKKLLDGSHVKESKVGTNQQGQYVVTLKFNDEGAKLFGKATKEAAPSKKRIIIMLDDKVLSAPTVNQEILGGNAEISGSFTVQSASELANLIQAGALPVNFTEIESSTKSAQLGDEALLKSVQGAAIGIFLVMLFMLIYYKIPGLIADIALGFYMLIFLFLYTSLGATLTLPGIAALILSVGMAVDANVIIFERIKEEIIEGKSVKAALKNGFSKAFSTIMDSQVTTVIAGIVLYAFGTGPIKGFAVTLILGIIVSLFTAIVITKFLFQNLLGFIDIQNTSLLGINQNKKVDKEIKDTKLKIVDKFKIFAGISIAIAVIGIGLGFTKGYNMGIDFTGGTTIDINLHKYVENNELLDIIKAYDTTASVDYLGESKDKIQIKTTEKMEESKRLEVFSKYKEKYGLKDTDLLQSGYIGPSIGKEIQSKAVVSVIIASIFMLIYISFRFKFTFGISAIMALVHDVLIVIAIYAIFRVPVNSPFVAAILTVVGYSINDTIVVFDRIRENAKLHPKMDKMTLADVSIRQTVTRSINTSVTTLLSILMLYILGVDSIKEFTFPLLVGILSGTYSSIFIASPLWVLFEKIKEDKKKQELAQKKKK
ncbi:SecD/SecF fusion protein [[Eubacterium] yurii]|nr:SecD/SecF fusion protein [[Eubacterium] yurii]